MASQLKIPSPLRRSTGGEAAISVNGGTIKEVLDELFIAHPDIKNHLIEENGDLRNFVNIFVNNEDIRHSGGLDSKVTDNSDVRIILLRPGERPWKLIDSFYNSDRLYFGKINPEYQKDDQSKINYHLYCNIQ